MPPLCWQGSQVPQIVPFITQQNPQVEVSSTSPLTTSGFLGCCQDRHQWPSGYNLEQSPTQWLTQIPCPQACPRCSKYPSMSYNSWSFFLTKKVTFNLQGTGLCSTGSTYQNLHLCLLSDWQHTSPYVDLYCGVCVLRNLFDMTRCPRFGKTLTLLWGFWCPENMLCVVGISASGHRGELITNFMLHIGDFKV